MMRVRFASFIAACIVFVVWAAICLAQESKETPQQQSIAAVFERILAERGLEAAEAAFKEMAADTSGAYTWDPYELVLGLPNRLALQGKRAEAIALLRLLEGKYGDNPRYWLELGKAYLMFGDRDQTVASLKKAQEMSPHQGDIPWMLENLDELMRIAKIQVESEGKYEPGDNTGIQGPYLGQEPPGSTPKVFAPGILCSTGHEYSIAFMPDGKEIYFSRGGVGILVCRWTKEGWTAPKTVELVGGGAYNDEPGISPDGKRMFFCSRPDMRQPRELYVAKRGGDGWGEPQRLFPGMYPTASRSGNLYYTADVAGQRGNSDLVMRRPEGGGYSEPEIQKGGAYSETQDAHPFIAPDESYIIFDSMRDGVPGLRVAFREKDGSWGPAHLLNDVLGIPPAGQGAVSPDGKYFFFCLAGDMYWVSTDFIEELRAK